MGKEMLPSEEEARKLGYSQGVKAGNMIFISGQVALNSKGEVVGKNDFSTQVRCVFENLQSTLKSKGASLDDIVKVTVYLKDMENAPEFRRIRSKYFKKILPASTLVQVVSLIMEELMIEMEAIAIIER